MYNLMHEIKSWLKIYTWVNKYWCFLCYTMLQSV